MAKYFGYKKTTGQVYPCKFDEDIPQNNQDSIVQKRIITEGEYAEVDLLALMAKYPYKEE